MVLDALFPKTVRLLFQTIDPVNDLESVKKLKSLLSLKKEKLHCSFDTTHYEGSKRGDYEGRSKIVRKRCIAIPHQCLEMREVFGSSQASKSLFFFERRDGLNSSPKSGADEIS